MHGHTHHLRKRIDRRLRRTRHPHRRHEQHIRTPNRRRVPAHQPRAHRRPPHLATRRLPRQHHAHSLTCAPADGSCIRQAAELEAEPRRDATTLPPGPKPKSSAPPARSAGLTRPRRISPALEIDPLRSDLRPMLVNAHHDRHPNQSPFTLRRAASSPSNTVGFRGRRLLSNGPAARPLTRARLTYAVRHQGPGHLHNRWPAGLACLPGSTPGYDIFRSTCFHTEHRGQRRCAGESDQTTP